MASIGGLVSGLDTATIITQLMQLEARPQTLLKQQAAAGEKQVSALQAINTKLVTLRGLADRLAGTQPSGTTSAWTSSTATSTASSVKVAALTGRAASGSVTFDVLTLSRTHSVASGEASPTDDVLDESPPPVITVSRGGITTQITAQSASIKDVQAAINTAGVGLQANLMQVAPDRYRLVVTSTEPGALGSFDVSNLSGATTLTQGQDAVLDLGGGVTARSADGVFTDLLPGTTVTPTAVETGVTVSARTDPAARTTAVKAMVDAANAVLTDIRNQSVFVAGGTNGVLNGDGAARAVAASLTASVSTVGASPSEAGIQLTRDGLLTLDTERLTALMASDPARAQAVVGALADRLQAVARAASDPTNGSLTAAITNRQSGVRSITTQVTAWDDRLAARRSTLEKTYASLEVALGKLQSQQTWLSGQLKSLSSS